MKTTTILTGLASLLTVTQAQEAFGVIAAHSASAIHLQPFTASGRRIHIGGVTASYCPTEVQQEAGCPPGNQTTFIGGNGSLEMGAEVPGGQQVYIDPECGAMSYTLAHSESMPTGAITGNWSVVPGSSFGSLSFTYPLAACNASTFGNWTVYAQLPNVTLPSYCLGLDALTSNATSSVVWEYT